MGSTGSNESDHKAYLQDNNFSKLDEYDEQVLNDATVTVSIEEERSQEREILSDKDINSLIRRANTAINLDNFTPTKIRDGNALIRQMKLVQSQQSVPIKFVNKIKELEDTLDEFRK